MWGVQWLASLEGETVGVQLSIIVFLDRIHKIIWILKFCTFAKVYPMQYILSLDYFLFVESYFLFFLIFFCTEVYMYGSRFDTCKLSVDFSNVIQKAFRKLPLFLREKIRNSRIFFLKWNKQPVKKIPWLLFSSAEALSKYPCSLPPAATGKHEDVRDFKHLCDSSSLWLKHELTLGVVSFWLDLITNEQY